MNQNYRMSRKETEEQSHALKKLKQVETRIYVHIYVNVSMQSACNAYIRITKLYLPLVSQCNITIYLINRKIFVHMHRI